jgi:hypothetical protein
MADKNSKKKPKRLSKGQRKHVRRLKQAAGKELGTNNPSSSSTKQVREHKKQDGS